MRKDAAAETSTTLCKYCVHGQEMCTTEEACTREDGHAGIHRFCGTSPGMHGMFRDDAGEIVRSPITTDAIKYGLIRRKVAKLNEIERTAFLQRVVERAETEILEGKPGPEPIGLLRGLEETSTDDE